jgi:hypothetical protein
MEPWAEAYPRAGARPHTPDLRLPMSRELSYEESRDLLSTGQSTGRAACDPRAQQVVSSSAAWGVAVTPADSALANGACDGFYLSADADVVVRLENMTSSLTFAGLKGGSFVPLRCIRIVSTTAGTVTALYFNKPA